MKRIIDDLRNIAKKCDELNFSYSLGIDYLQRTETEQLFINNLKRYGREYFAKYYRGKNIQLQCETEDFYENIRNDEFFAFRSKDYFDEFRDENKKLFNLTLLLKRDNKINKELADDIIQHYLNNLKQSRQQRIKIINPYPNPVTLSLVIPISDDIPTLSEYIDIRVTEKMNRHKKRVEEENRVIERMNNCKDKQKITGEELLRLIKREKKSRARKFNKTIEKYDVAGKLIETYADRQECIEKNNFTKSALSKHLSGKRKKLNGYIYKEVG